VAETAQAYFLSSTKDEVHPLDEKTLERRELFTGRSPTSAAVKTETKGVS
jgi:hypothetical protein